MPSKPPTWPWGSTSRPDSADLVCPDLFETSACWYFQGNHQSRFSFQGNRSSCWCEQGTRNGVNLPATQIPRREPVVGWLRVRLHVSHRPRKQIVLEIPRGTAYFSVVLSMAQGDLNIQLPATGTRSLFTRRRSPISDLRRSPGLLIGSTAIYTRPV